MREAGGGRREAGKSEATNRTDPFSVARLPLPASRFPAPPPPLPASRLPPPASFHNMVSLLDIIGPVMVGPSSSHTAGACRLGLLARGLVGGTPDRARIELHGSFARTGEGHGTDKAIVAGLMGFRPDDDRIRQALEIAEKEGLAYRFEKTTLDEEAHPNSVRITLERGDRSAVMTGSSLG